MKKLVLLVLWMVFTFSAYSQRRPKYYFPHAYEKGDIVINGGFSLGYHRQPSQPNSFRTGNFPPLPVFIEYGFTRSLSAGVYGSYFQREFRYDGVGENNVLYKIEYVYIGGRISWHFAPWLEEKIFPALDSDHLDIYVSATGGSLRRRAERFLEVQDNDPFIGGILGARYFVAEHFGIFGEAGYMPFEVVTIGLSGRF